jgi:E3 ubiquitin-protein ligase CCNP1IP1
MADMDLFCNNKKCRKRLTTCAWITSCSHAFCDEDADHAFFSTESNITCPACSSHLPEKHDIVKVDLNPPDKFKSVSTSPFNIKGNRLQLH